MRRNLRFAVPFLFGCALTAAGCQGYRPLYIANETKDPIVVTIRTKPEQWPRADTMTAVQHKSYTMAPGDTLRIFSYVTDLRPERLRARELPIDCLRIETSKDTMVAASAKAILENAAEKLDIGAMMLYFSKPRVEDVVEKVVGMMQEAEPGNYG